MNRNVPVLGVLSVCLALAVPAPALTVDPFDLTGEAFSDLGVVEPLGPCLDSPCTGTTIQGQILSQAFLLDNGTYLYLYQFMVDDDSPSGIVQMKLNNIFGPELDLSGYLTDPADTMPSGFLSGGVLPTGQTYVEDPTDDLDYLSYYFYSPTGPLSLSQGEYSAPLFVISSDPPAPGYAQAIDGSNTLHSAIVANAVIPEPLTAAGVLLGLTGLAGYFHRRIGRAG